MLAACGVELWRVQAMARHSSNAIALYVGQAHLPSLQNIAAEAGLHRALEGTRRELHTLSAEVSKVRGIVAEVRTRGPEFEAMPPHETLDFKVPREPEPTNAALPHPVCPLPPDDEEPPPLWEGPASSQPVQFTLPAPPPTQYVRTPRADARLHIVAAGTCWTLCGWNFRNTRGAITGPDPLSAELAAPSCIRCFGQRGGSDSSASDPGSP